VSKIVLFAHSLLSDWNHGNAHFLRGIVSELVARGHRVECYEHERAWSLTNLVEDHGTAPIDALQKAYPELGVVRYADDFDPDEAVDGADLVIVHEWTPPELVKQIGALRARGSRFVLLFHDTHHRSATDPEAMARYELDAYDGVLAFGNTVRDLYQRNGWGRRVYTFHEAADTRRFGPLGEGARDGDLVWIGNWGDDERTQELEEYLLGPVRRLGLRARVHGVRYPEPALAALAAAGIDYAGWLPNYSVPEAFARFALTIHVPRQPYARALIGIPTIRMFEALACAMPLVSAPWQDAESLFEVGSDFVMVSSGAAMQEALRRLLADPAMARELGEHGRATILRRHTCRHRVDQLTEICRELGLDLGAACA
jgi:spore maturation protein CgeB